LENPNAWIPRYAFIAAAVCAAGGVAYAWVRRRRPQETGPADTSSGIFWGMMLAYIALFSTLNVLSSLSFHKYTDTAIEAQTIRSIARTGLPLSSVQHSISESPNILAHHASLFYYAIAPLYRIFDTPVVLFPLWVTAVALAALPIWRISRKHLGETRWALIPPLGYLLHPTVQYSSVWELHALVLGAPFIAFAFEALEEKRPRRFLILCLLGLTVREDMTFSILSLCLYGLASGRERKRCLLVAVLAASWYLAYTEIVAPALSPDAAELRGRHFAHLGDTPSQQLASLLLPPWKGWASLCSLPKIGNGVLFFLPTLWVPLATGWKALSFALPFGLMFLSESASLYSIFLYYSMPVLPIVFACLPTGIERLCRGGPGRRALPAALLASSLAASVLYGPAPWSIQFFSQAWKLADFKAPYFHKSSYQITERTGAARAMLREIPGEAIVSAPNYFLLPLIDHEVYFLQPDEIRRWTLDRAGYAVLDHRHPNRYGFQGLPWEEQRIFLEKRGFGLMIEEGSCYLFRKGRRLPETDGDTHQMGSPAQGGEGRPPQGDLQTQLPDDQRLQQPMPDLQHLAGLPARSPKAGGRAYFVGNRKDLRTAPPHRRLVQPDRRGAVRASSLPRHSPSGRRTGPEPAGDRYPDQRDAGRHDPTLR
jgi:uncharacterized membrane protein